MSTATDPFKLAASRYFGPNYRTDPVAWSRDKLHLHLWSAQQQFCNSIVHNRYTAVPSAHDQGKSFGAAFLVAWWLDVHPVGEAFVVTTAPTAPQVEAILWREIGKLHRGSKGLLKGRLLGGGYPQWYIGPELVAYGRKPADYQQDAFQGIHARYVLVIIDEADGVPESLFTAADALATNVNARVLAIGNPDNPTSHFAKVCKPGSGWNVVRLDGLRGPNFTEERTRPYPELQQYMRENNVPFSTEYIPEGLREMLLDPVWVSERMPRWGVHRTVDSETGQVHWETPALWQSKVRGMTPDMSGQEIIPLSWIMEAQARYQAFVDDGGDFDQIPGKRIYGVDVARFGADETVIATRQGPCLISLDGIGKQDTMTTANRVKARLRYPASEAKIDVIGVGAGVVDRLRELEQNVSAFNASANAGTATDVSGEFTFNNSRSAAWWGMRELLDPALGSTVMLPPHEQLTIDLSTPKWTVSPGSKIVVESKESINKRLGRSPDYGDACVIAFTNFKSADGTAVYQAWGDVTPDARLDQFVAEWE